MERRYSMSDLIEGFARRSHFPRREAEAFVKLFFTQIETNLLRENVVKVKGFGTFKLVEVDSREIIDVRSGERKEIAPFTKVSFTPDPVLRDEVNKPFSDFETVILHEDVDLELMEGDGVDGVNKPIEAYETTWSSEPSESSDSSEASVFFEPSEVFEPSSASESSEVSDATVPSEPLVTEDSVIDASKSPVLAPSEPSLSSASSASSTAPLVQKAAVVEEADIVQYANHVSVSENRHGGLHFLIGLIVAFVFLVVGYILGYYVRPVVLPELTSGAQTPTKMEKKAVATPVAPQGSAKPTIKETAEQSADSTVSKPAKKQSSEVLAYPQLEGGEYYIVGVKGTEVMSPGKTLLNISLKYYKSQDFVPYICLMNGIKNPDIVPLNKELRIPELKHK